MGLPHLFCTVETPMPAHPAPKDVQITWSEQARVGLQQMENLGIILPFLFHDHVLIPSTTLYHISFLQSNNNAAEFLLLPLFCPSENIHAVITAPYIWQMFLMNLYIEATWLTSKTIIWFSCSWCRYPVTTFCLAHLQKLCILHSRTLRRKQ